MSEFLIPKNVINSAISEAPVAANRADELIAAYDLPESVVDLRILDIGGSQSNLTAQLLDDGADAYAIDPLYENHTELDRRRREHFLLEVLELHPDLKGKVEANDPRLIKGLESDPSTIHYRESLLKYPYRYIPASTHALPFKDNTFDIVLSSYAIFGVTTKDITLLTQSFNEALRVVKSGGSLQLIPVTLSPGLSPDEIANQREVLKSLYDNRNLKLNYKKAPLGGAIVGRLAITKIS